MFSMGNAKVTNLRVVRLVMIETGTYNEQFARPYNMNVDGTVMATINSRINNQGGASFNASALSGIAGTFIAPQATPESSVGIINGWNERRIRFLLEVECESRTGGSKTAYVQGYTSFMGVTNSGATAPDMEFFINSITYTRKSMQQTPFGMHCYEYVVDNSHILYSNSWSDMYQPGQTRLLRPQDIYKTMSLSHLPGVYDNSLAGVFDGTSVLKNEATKSRRSNGLAGAYAARIIDSYCTASELSGFGQSEARLLDQSREHVMEGSAGADPFIMAIVSVTGSNVTNRFRYSDLMAIDGNTDNVATFSAAGHAQAQSTHSAGMTSNWHSGDSNTVAATILSQAIPSLMMDLMIKRITFKSTNHVIGGQNTTTVLAGESFTNLEMGPSVDTFVKRLEMEVIRDITYDGQLGYCIEMRVDLLGETWISVSIGNLPLIDYVTPSFCDALFTPIMTSNINVFTGVSEDFTKLIDGVRDTINETRVGGNILTNV